MTSQQLLRTRRLTKEQVLEIADDMIRSGYYKDRFDLAAAMVSALNALDIIVIDTPS